MLIGLARRPRHNIADFGGKKVGTDRRLHIFAPYQDHQTLDVVAKLADISRPIVRLEHCQRVIADPPGFDASLAGDLMHEMVDQEGNILPPLGQAREP